MGASARASPPAIATPTIMSSADLSPRPVVCAPITAPTLPAAVIAMTANPASTLTRFTRRLDPIAAAGETPCCCASAPIAAICHTFPGTYLPRFDTNQMRAALANGSDWDHTRRVARHASMRMTYVASTSAPEPSTRTQSNLSSASAGATSRHCFATARAAKPMTTAATTHCATSLSLLVRRANDRAIDTGVAARCRFRGKAGKRDHASCPPQLGAAVRVIQQPIERGGEGSHVARRNEKPGAIVLHRVGEPAGLVGDDRCFAELGFDRNQAQTFICGWNDQRRGTSIQVH